MRKYILGFAALSLLYIASSCNKETIETADGQNQIKFQTFLGKQTKASEATLSTLQSVATVVPVNIYKSDNTLWNSWDLEWNSTDNVWDYNTATPVLQPGFNLKYYAWYPKAAATLTNTSGTVTFSYTVPGVSSQVDLLAASVDATLDADIDLQFAHLLSQVNFSLQEVKDVKITINSITLSGINSVATYTFGSGGGWSAQATADSYVYNLTGATFPTNEVAPVATIPLGTGSNGLMLMPQTFNAATAIFTIDFTLQDTDDNYLVGTSSTGETAVAYLKDFTVNTWVSGTRYNYLIDFTNYLADRYIKFDVTVDSWVNSTPATQLVEVATANKASLEGAITSLFTANTTAGNEVFQITVKEALTGNITLDIAEAFTATDKIVIYIGGLATNNITVSGGGWTPSKSGTYVTLTKN